MPEERADRLQVVMQLTKRASFSIRAQTSQACGNSLEQSANFRPCGKALLERWPTRSTVWSGSWSEHWSPEIRSAKVRTAVAALAYLRNPYDHIFDFQVEAGFIDDRGVIAEAWKSIGEGGREGLWLKVAARRQQSRLGDQR